MTEVAPYPTWATDVHTHAAVLQSLWQQPTQSNKVMRKKHLSADTIKLIAAKRFHRHQLGKIRRHRRQAVLRQVFDSWRSQHPREVQFQPWLRHCDRLEAVHGAHFADLSPRVVIAVRQDDMDFYESLAAQAGSESFCGSRRLWAAIRHAIFLRQERPQPIRTSCTNAGATNSTTCMMLRLKFLFVIFLREQP